MDFNKATKAEIQSAYLSLQAENTQLQATAKEAIEIANYFAANLNTIDQFLSNAPFINKEGKFFKKLFWVIANFNSIKNLIEDIATLIRNWKAKIQEAQQKQIEAQSKSN